MAKATENFKRVIQQHLNDVAEMNPVFAEKLKNPKKKIDDCITYILNRVKQSKVNGYEDSEIFGMAMHYYNEENIDPGKPFSSGQIVVNHQVKLTDKEIAELKEKARQKVIDDEMARLKKKPKKAEAKKEEKEGPTLF